MESHASDELLSFQDTVFINLERPHMPLHIGVLEMFDGDFSLDELRAHFESKLGEVPRYTQRVETSLLGIAHPRWVADSHFDIRQHVRRVQLEHGTEAELQTLVGRMISQVMDRSRPLWDVIIVDGFKGGQTPLIWRVHHCLVDGIAGVSLMRTLMDSSPGSHSRRRKPFHGKATEAPPRGLADTVLTSCFEFTDGLLSVASAGLHFTEGLVGGDIVQSLEAWRDLAPGLLTPPQPLPFNVPCAGAQNFAWTQMPLNRIEEIRAAACGTVNDVVLAVLIPALRRYTAAHRQDVHRPVRIMVPVNTRRPDSAGRLGVDISLIPVDLPLDVTDPLAMLRLVETTTRELKSAHMARAIGFLSACLSALPGPAKPLAAWLLSNPLPVLPWNVICTNVPGPPEPLYLLGRKMVACHPYLPVIPFGTNAGLSCAFYSYNGVLYSGFAADVAAMHDLARFMQFFELAYSELQRAALKSRPRARAAAQPA